MDEDKNGPKYAKLLTEYSKLRAQAKVLKNAVLEEKNKVSVLQESLRVKDQNLRRAETELDSVNFRNKQLEHRVQVIQDDLQKSSKGGNSKSSKMRDNQVTGNGQMEQVIVEELQKRIMENAQLASTISDKNNEIEMLTNRVKDLSLQLSKHINDNSETEKKLRREIEMMSLRSTELETKIIEATSQVGSEDGVSLASDSTLPLHMTTSADERIALLEKELNHYRTQYELMKINDALRMDENLLTQPNLLQNNSQPRKVLSSQSSTSSSMSTNNNHSTFVNYPTSGHSSASKSSPSQNSKGLPEPTTSSRPDDEHNEAPSRDQLVFEYFSKRFDELFHEKCKAESKAINYMTECDSLKNNLELLLDEIQEANAVLKESKTSYERLEEDFVTTRVNYEDQICVLTDQVLHLSDQLASR